MINSLKISVRDFHIRIIRDKFWDRLFKNIIIAIMGQGGASGLNLITLLLITTILGPNQYGMFTLAQSYMFLIDSFINFQSWQGVIKFGSEAIEENDDNRLAAVIKAGMIIDFSSAFIGCILGLCISPLVIKFLGWNEKILGMMLLFCIEMIFHISGTPTALLRMLQKYHLVAIHSVVFALIRLIIICLYFIFYEFNLYTFTLVYVFIDILNHLSLILIGLISITKKMKFKKIFFASLKTLDKKYYSYTIWSNLSATCDLPIKYFDVFFLSAISVEIVAVYKFFKQVLQIFGLLINPISQVIMPQLGGLVAKNEIERAYKIVIKFRNIILCLLIPIGLGVAIVAPFIFKIILDDIYINNYLIFILLLISNIFTLSYIALHPFFSVMGFARESTQITLLSNICYVIITFIFIKHVGVYGIIFASFIQFLIVVVLKSKKIKSTIRSF